jgi:hypothetical protein
MGKALHVVMQQTHHPAIEIYALDAVELGLRRAVFGQHLRCYFGGFGQCCVAIGLPRNGE